MGYYLAYGIYLSSSTFVKTIAYRHENNRVHFAKAQKALRKEVERAFRVIVCGPARFWDQKAMCISWKHM